MKKIILLAITLLMLTGCGNKEYQYDANNRLSTIYTSTILTIKVDTETCVEYIDRYEGGISVMYNADGTIKLNEECLNDGK